MSKPKKPRRRPIKKRRRRLGPGLRLMPWKQVATIYNRRTGENLTRSRIWQIGMAAEAKLRRALAELAVDAGVIPSTVHSPLTRSQS